MVGESNGCWKISRSLLGLADALGRPQLYISLSKSVLSLFRRLGSLVCTNGLLLLLEWRQSSSEGSGLLLSEVLGKVSLSLGVGSSSGDSLLGEDGQDLCDCLSHLSNLGELHLGLGRHLADSKAGEFFLNTTFQISIAQIETQDDEEGINRDQ